MTLANLKPRRFNREEYYRLADSGVLSPNERVELIDGEIVSMPAQNLPHANAVTASNTALHAAFTSSHLIRCQCPVTLADDCEPEPDFALVTREHMRACNALGKHPTCPDLILEVSDRSLGYDRGEKVGLFARGAVPEYWILNVRRRCLEQRREPSPDPDAAFGFSYSSTRLFHEGEQVSPSFAPEKQIAVSDLLGPPVKEE
jgi:Uma2 family endonuclease